MNSQSAARAESDQIAKMKYDGSAETDLQVIQRVAEIAAKRAILRAHVASAWMLQKAAVTAPIIGASKLSHLEDAVGALSVQLSTEDLLRD